MLRIKDCTLKFLVKITIKKHGFFLFITPIIYQKNAHLVLLFFSNICVDLVKFKKLCIEILDLRKVKDLEKVNFVKDHNDDPVFDYRATNIVLGANDQEDLEEIIKDKNFVEMNFAKNYENFTKQYLPSDYSLDCCIKEILKKIQV